VNSKKWAEMLKWRSEAGPVQGEIRLMFWLGSRWQREKIQ